jgi:hypothetical protein
MSKRRFRLHWISRRLSTHQLRRLQEKDLALNFEDILGAPPTRRSSPFFLGFYSPDGIRYALEKYGLYDELRKRGYDNFKTVINTRDPYKQRIAIYYDKKDSQHLLGELIVKRKHITVYPPFPSRIYGRNFEVIAVEWLCMQHPKGKFTPEKPRLPGQKYPGLGLGDMVMEILVIMTGRLRLAGLLNVPEHFHNAQMYSPQFKYIDPLYEAKRMALERDLLSRYPLATVSWAIELKCVTENTKPFEWFVAEQIIPLNRDLQDYFSGKEYRKYVEKAAQQYHYELNRELFESKRDQMDKLITC